MGKRDAEYYQAVLDNIDFRAKQGEKYRELHSALEECKQRETDLDAQIEQAKSNLKAASKDASIDDKTFDSLKAQLNDYIDKKNDIISDANEYQSQLKLCEYRISHAGQIPLLDAHVPIDTYVKQMINTIDGLRANGAATTSKSLQKMGDFLAERNKLFITKGATYAYSGLSIAGNTFRKGFLKAHQANQHACQKVFEKFGENMRQIKATVHNFSNKVSSVQLGLMSRLKNAGQALRGKSTSGVQYMPPAEKSADEYTSIFDKASDYFKSAEEKTKAKLEDANKSIDYYKSMIDAASKLKSESKTTDTVKEKEAGKEKLDVIDLDNIDLGEDAVTNDTINLD